MFNQITIIGNVGRDPEIRYLPSGDAVANLSVATSERWKDKQTGEQREKTQWHRVKAFGKLAEIIGQYVRQGSKVMIQGSMDYGSYEKDGVTHYTADVKADTMKMLDGRREDGEGGQGGGEQRQQRAAAPASRPQGRPPAPAPAPRPAGGFDDMDDDIPF